MEEKITVVIPVFNAEHYLAKCLESVVGQQYRNLEIIVVDDASTDASAAIVRRYAELDERIVLIAKETNEGVSLARNTALDHATGDYLLFVDGDDWLEADTCTCALEAARSSGADVIMWSYIRELSTDSRKKVIFNEDIVFNREEVKEKLYRRMVGAYGRELARPENADALCTVWGKLYRSELIQKNRIRFYDIRKIGTYEDGLFNLDVFSRVEKAVFLNRYFYHYRRNNDSSLTTAYNPNLPQQQEHLFALLDRHLKGHDLDSRFGRALDNRIVLSLIPLGGNEMARKGGMITTIRGIRQLISRQEYRKAMVGFPLQCLPIHWKAFFTLARMQCAVGVFLLLWVIQKIRGR